MIIPPVFWSVFNPCFLMPSYAELLCPVLDTVKSSFWDASVLMSWLVLMVSPSIPNFWTAKNTIFWMVKGPFLNGQMQHEIMKGAAWEDARGKVDPWWQELVHATARWVSWLSKAKVVIFGTYVILCQLDVFLMKSHETVCTLDEKKKVSILPFVWSEHRFSGQHVVNFSDVSGKL